MTQETHQEKSNILMIDTPENRGIVVLLEQFAGKTVYGKPHFYI